MTETRARGRAPSHRIDYVVGDHRTNDVIYGHVGRLTYVPGEDEGGGSLRFNRITDEAPSFRVVSPSESWYPGTKADEPAPAPPVKQSRRPQEAWLLTNAPDAFMGLPDLDRLLSDEPKGTDATERRGLPNLPLLAYGEITNLTNPTRAAACTALAMAVGDAGHILRIARLQHHNWRWAKNESVTLRLGTADATEEGHWCGDGVPIVQIKFATHRKLRNSTRWLLVQTTSSTVIFEPELLRVPVAVDDHAACSYIPTGPPYIAPNPIMTLSMEQTGGCPQSDVAFHPESDTRPPQLAVIDQGGNWSVWDITGDRHARQKRLIPVRRSCGHFMNGPMADLPLVGAAQIGVPHRIMWLPSTKKESSDHHRFPSSPSASSNMSSAGEADELPGLLGRPLDNLLLFDTAALKVMKIGGDDRVLRVINMVRHSVAGSILDVQRYPGSETWVLVLTTTTVFLLDLETAASGPESSSALDDSRDGDSVNRPTVLLSCPHLRNQADKTLKLSVAIWGSARGGETCLACVYSKKDTRISVFWFSTPDVGGQVMFRQQLFQLEPTPGDGEGRELSLETLVIIPGDFLRDYGSRGARGLGLDYVESNVQFFQVVILSSDMALRSLLCASSCKGETLVAPHVRDNVVNPLDRRKMTLAYFGDSFVVADEFDDRSLFKQPSAPAPPKKLLPSSQDASAKVRTVDLSPVVELLSRRVTQAIQARDSPMKGTYEDEQRNAVSDKIARGIESGHMPLATLSELVDNKRIVSMDGGAISSEFIEELRQIRRTLGTDTLQILDLSRQGTSGETIHQALSRTWPDTPEGGILDEVRSVQRQRLLDSVATRLALSQIGVAVIPQNILVPQSSQTFRPAARQSESPFTGPPTPPDTESIATSTARSNTGGVKEQSAEDWEEEDATVSRLRQYALSINRVPPQKEGESRLLSHWQLGSDPAEYTWSLADSSRRDAADDALSRRRKRDEMRRRRREEKMAASSQLTGRTDDESGGGSGRQTFTQPVPRIVHSSQPREVAAFSQRSSQTVPPSQTMSQPLGGLHGGRTTKKQKAKKKVGGFR